MSSQSPLARAIHSALVKHRTASAPTSNISAEAAAARALMEASANAVSDFKFPEWTQRLDIAVKLLRASADHGRALATLLEVNHVDFGVSAIILHRSQVEQFLRGAFIAGPATEEELSFFVANDEMPKRQRQGINKPVKLSPSDLSVLVSDWMNLDNNKLPTSVKNAWGALSGLSHGGLLLLNLYSGEGTEIGCQASNATLLQILDNTTAFANFVLAACARMSSNSEGEIATICNPVMEEWDRYRAKHSVRPEYEHMREQDAETD